VLFYKGYAFTEDIKNKCIKYNDCTCKSMVCDIAGQNF